MTDQLTRMDSPVAGLYASAPAPLPFAPQLHVRAFLLRRSHGNVLVYASRGLDGDAVDALGGATRRYLNHRHEALFGADGVPVPLFLHDAERAAVEPKLHVRGTFSRRHVLDEDLEVIPTPGHTPGATVYLWDTGEHRFLFTGDTIYLDDGEWVTAVLDSSERVPYLESLELIRELDFDVLVPWAATSGQPCYAVTSQVETKRRIDAIMERLWRGQDH
jgi:hypothetical protein